MNKVRVYLEEGQPVEADRALEGAEECQPGFLETPFFRGVLYKERGEYERALREWQPFAPAYPRVHPSMHQRSCRISYDRAIELV